MPCAAKTPALTLTCRTPGSDDTLCVEEMDEFVLVEIPDERSCILLNTDDMRRLGTYLLSRAAEIDG